MVIETAWLPEQRPVSTDPSPILGIAPTPAKEEPLPRRYFGSPAQRENIGKCPGQSRQILGSAGMVFVKNLGRIRLALARWSGRRRCRKGNRGHAAPFEEKLSNLDAVHWATEVNVYKSKAGQIPLGKPDRLGTRRRAPDDSKLKRCENFGNVTAD